MGADGQVVPPPHQAPCGHSALHLAAAALNGSRFFVRSHVTKPLPCLHFYWLEFKAELLQYW